MTLLDNLLKAFRRTQSKDSLMKSINRKLTKTERKYLLINDFYSIHIAIQIIWIFFITVPWMPQINKEISTKTFGIFLDYQILVPLVNMILFWIIIGIDERMNKKYLSTLSQDSNRESKDV